MLIKKVKFNLRKHLVKLIPRNIGYKAKSRYQLSGNADERPAGVTFEVVYENCETSLEVVPELNQYLSDYTVYDEISGPQKNIYTTECQYVVATVENGRLYSDNFYSVAVTNADGILLEDVSHLVRGEDDRINNTEYFKRKYFIKPTYVDGVVLNLLSGGGATWNYFHWLVDTLARLHLVKEAGLLDDVQHFLIPAYGVEYQVESLNKLGISKDRIIVATTDTHIVASKLISTTNPRGIRSQLIPEWVSSYIANSFSSPSDSLGEQKLVYISRSDSKKRKVINEDEVMNVLGAYGFESVVLSELDFLDKIKLFHSADVIVTMSGAALTNLFFSREGSSVIEIFPENYVHSMFYNIANFRKLKYRFLICGSDQKFDNVHQANYEDIQVDVDALDAMLKEQLKS